MSKNRNERWRVTASLILCIFSIQITGCNEFFNSQHLKDPLHELALELKKEAKSRPKPEAALWIGWSDSLESIASTAESEAKNPPPLIGTLSADRAQAEQFAFNNQHSLLKWLDQMERHARTLRGLVFDISRHAYHNTNDTVIWRDQSLVLVALHLHRHLYKSLSAAATPLVLGISAPELNDSPVVQNFRKVLLDRFFGFLGMQMVLEQDIGKVLEILGDYHKNKTLPKRYADIINRIQSGVVGSEKKARTSISSVFSQLKADERKDAENKITALQQSYSSYSLLYSPEANRNFIVGMFVFLGNMTWGLFNTVVGVGIILATIIVSPFTEAVNFPTFAISASGLQIYVDVSGMGPMPGKMSMGIFEFDNYTSHAFASDHEGGHSMQSAILGPFYLPAALVSYMISGFDRGFIESWADSWGEAWEIM